MSAAVQHHREVRQRLRVARTRLDGRVTPPAQAVQAGVPASEPAISPSVIGAALLQ